MRKTMDRDLKFTDLNANLKAVRLDLPGHPEPLWRIPSLVIKDGTVDVSGKTVVIGAIQGKDGIGTSSGIKMAL